MDNVQAMEAAEVPRVAEEARAHPKKEAIGALAFDVLSRQAEGRTLFAGKEYVESRAKEHGVERDDAASETGNLLTILERGPSTPRERGLLSAFAVIGFAAAHETADADEKGALAARLVRHADWLEVATPYAIYPFVDTLCEADAAAAVWDAVAAAVLAEREATPAARARNAARISALSAASGPAARKALERVRAEVEEPAARALCDVLGGPDLGSAEQARLSGRVSRVPTASFRSVLRWVSGLALLQWMAVAVGRIVGFRREAQIELVPGGLRVKERTTLLGRVLREGEETYTYAALAGIGRRVRYPALPLLVGALALSAGILFGGLLTFDGVRTGDTVLLLVGAIAVLAGGGLDLALSVLLPGRTGRVAVDLDLLPRRSLRISHVDVKEADRFLDALGRRVAKR